MDVGSNNKYPAGALSNFTAYRFIFDGVVCSSMEGFLQSLKFDDHEVQVEVCSLVGFQAKKIGQTRNDAWKAIQILWWKGDAYKRESTAYQYLLDRAFSALAKNKDFQKALLATGKEHLTHSIGEINKYDTVLTEQEFCSRLMNERKNLWK